MNPMPGPERSPYPRVLQQCEFCSQRFDRRFKKCPHCRSAVSMGIESYEKCRQSWGGTALGFLCFAIVLCFMVASDQIRKGAIPWIVGVGCMTTLLLGRLIYLTIRLRPEKVDLDS